jgi:uncharacterized membrane protein
MKQINLYTIVKYISLFCAPFAPAVFFGSKVYAGLSEVGVGYGLALLAAICAAVALETVGLLAGHTLVDFVGLGRYELSGLSFILLACYVAIGVYELWNTIGAVMFGVALLVYLLVALKQYSDKLDHQKEDKRAEQKEDRHEALQARIAVKLAEIEANKQVEIAKVAGQQSVVSQVASQHNTQPKATKTQLILQLHNEGVAQSEIPVVFLERYGETVHKGTVSNVLKANRISAD